MFAKSPKPVKFASVEYKEDDVRVRPHLAYDISEVDELRQRGMPISNQNLESLYYDGADNVSFDIPLDQQRGVDLNDLWNAAEDAKGRMRKYGIKSVDINPSKS